MDLFSALRGRFFSPELCRIAKRTDIGATIECLARTPVVVLGADLGCSVQLDADESQLIAMVESAARPSRCLMTDSANQLLNAFDALPPDDRREVAAAVLRRVLDEAPAEVSDESLVMAAEELFLELDAAEGKHGES